MITIGTHKFDHVTYDEIGDVLYLSKGAPSEALETHASPEGHAVRLGQSGEVVGLTLVNARWLVERDGAITITVPEQITAREEELASAFPA